MIFFPILFAFMEIVLHISVFKTFDLSLLYVLLFSAAYGLLAFALTSFRNRIVNKIIIGILTAAITAYFGLQTVYYNIFKVYVSVYSISQNAGDATEFWKEALHGIIASIPQLIFLIIIPIVAVIVMTKLGFIGVGLTEDDSIGSRSGKNGTSGKSSIKDRITDQSEKSSGKSSITGQSEKSSDKNSVADQSTEKNILSDAVEKTDTNSAKVEKTDLNSVNYDAGSINSNIVNNTASDSNPNANTADQVTVSETQLPDESAIPEFVIKAPARSAYSTNTEIINKTGIAVITRTSVILASFLLYIITVFSLRLSGTSANSPYDLYSNYFILDLGVQKLGIITSAGLDLKNTLSGSDAELDALANSGINGQNMSGLIPSTVISPTPAAVPDDGSSGRNDISQTANGDPSQNGQAGIPSGDSSQNSGQSDPAVSPTATPIPSPTPTPIDTSPNVLDIDFAALAENETKKEIKSLHEYFANSEPTNKNKYTGMFKGYNFIYLTCEGFSPWAVDENVTPTLYKLTHSGFVFTNFYNPIWYTSTSDGEYVECIGLLPYNSNSFKRSKNNALPFCFGWQFLKLGYTSRAYHAHTVTYYGRNETHPNMGYIFKAKRGGLPITDVWPESDLEMMELSLPEYINDEHFHAYYMTVSGHLEYSFNDNTQARRNKELVDDLPYSSEVKAYIACNAELDKALAYLIEELEKAGKLDNTVIAFGADHYPYGLSDEAIDEIAGEHVDRNFELYRNHFVIWNSQIEAPIIVDKCASGLDMMPTLSNLFGLEYDSRLFMGNDLLSDAPGLVIFSNQSFITDICKYNSKTHKVEMLADVELPEDYIATVSRIVQNKFTVSKNILLNDYYRYILDYIPNVVTEVPETYE